MTVSSSALPAEQGATLRLLILSLVIFLGFMTVAAPLPLIPLFVHGELGFGPLIVGLVMGAQAAVTLSTRAFSGSLADRRGAKSAVLAGTLVCALAALLYVGAIAAAGSPDLSLALLFAGRLALGLGDSLFITGAMAWSVPLAGSKAGKALVWVGIAIYAALALGAPLGVRIADEFGFMTVAFLVAGSSLAACLIAAALPGTPIIAGERISTLETIRRIWRPGFGLALSGVGYAVIAAFITLYYQSEGWSHAAYALAAFGGGLIIARLFFGRWPDKYGGAPVAVGALLVEIAGQLLLWLAPAMPVALLGAALTGFGYSLAFPALGIEAVKRVPPQSRGAALGAYVVFLDISMAATGPLAGLLVLPFGYPAVYLLGATAAVVSTLIAASLITRAAGR